MSLLVQKSNCKLQLLSLVPLGVTWKRSSSHRTDSRMRHVSGLSCWSCNVPTTQQYTSHMPLFPALAPQAASCPCIPIPALFHPQVPCFQLAPSSLQKPEFQPTLYTDTQKPVSHPLQLLGHPALSPTKSFTCALSPKQKGNAASFHTVKRAGGATAQTKFNSALNINREKVPGEEVRIQVNINTMQ